MNRLVAEHAWLPGGWARNVLLEWDSSGSLHTVQPDSGAATVHGIVIPGMANLHSHAFQRAMSGLTEYRANASDSFWSWRRLMYSFAQKLTPETLKAIALQLYVEMLKAGYTSVCEFHYLHHAANGQPYANPGEHALCLVDAAKEAGIGMTLLPVLYQYSGFGEKAPLPQQARFISSPEWILKLLEQLQRSRPADANLRYGAAPHSLRAVSPASLSALLEGLAPDAPVHIHIAEQLQEVDESIAATGARPVEWLMQNMPVDARWCLVHATHMTPDETLALARSGAVAGLCPTTEANLGDGLFDAPRFLQAGGRWGIGSDSHVSISLREELRLLEYGQRLHLRERNVLAGSPAAVGALPNDEMHPANSGSVGASLLRQALEGGAAASGRAVAGLAVGQRADMLVLDPLHSDLCARSGDQWLDSFIFSQHGPSPIRDVISGGRRVIEGHRHPQEEAIARGYRAALETLLNSP